VGRSRAQTLTFNSPAWNFSQQTYAKTAAAFTNPDYVAIVIGNYRWRLSLVPAEPEYAPWPVLAYLRTNRGARRENRGTMNHDWRDRAACLIRRRLSAAWPPAAR
jgi:hypothetical protein